MRRARPTSDATPSDPPPDRPAEGVPAQAGPHGVDALPPRDATGRDADRPGDPHDSDPAADHAAGETSPEGDEEREVGALRRCVVTRERGERAAMLRFVVGPDGALVPDLAARLPGRGMWLSPRSDVVETARARGAFARAARGPVTVPSDLLALLQAGLSNRVADLLGFARRAGQAVAGYAKAREWVQAGRAALVLQAGDGSPDERARLLSGARELPVCTALSAARLGAVFGRDHVVHVAVMRGRLAEQLAVDAGRLAGLLVPVATRPAGGRHGTARLHRPREAGAAGPGAAAAPGSGSAAPRSGGGSGTSAGGRPDPVPPDGEAGRTGSVAASGRTSDAGRRQGGQAATRRAGRAGMPARAGDVPTGAPVAQQSGRTGA